MLRQLSACRPRVLPPAKMTPARHSSFKKKTKRKGAREKTEQDERRTAELLSIPGGGRPHTPRRKPKDPDARSHVREFPHAHVIDWKNTEWKDTEAKNNVNAPYSIPLTRELC